MANAITKTTITETPGTRDVINVEGVKYSGTASGGGNTWIASTALTGLVEENITASGSGYRETYNDGSGNRVSLYSAAASFRTTTIGGFVVERSDTGAITDSNIRGSYFDNRIYGGGTGFPTSATNYNIHGFAKTAPTDYTKCFQWNMVYITGGTGMGQSRKIKTVTDDGTTVYLFTETAFTTSPDNTSTFVIEWSPLDLHYASVANGWGITQAWWDTLNLYPLGVEIVGDLYIGINGTTTYFGWADLLFCGKGVLGQWGWGNALSWWIKAPAIVDIGEGDYGTSSNSVPTVTGRQGVLGGRTCQPWAGTNVYFGNDSGSVVRVAGSTTLGQAQFAGTTNALSYNTYTYYALPYTSKNTRVYSWYAGGNWGTPLSISGQNIEGTVTNQINIDQKAQPTLTCTVTTNAGLAWLYYSNAGGSDAYFQEDRNCNLHINGYYQYSGLDVDWWNIVYDSDMGSSMDLGWNWVSKKSIVYTVVDSVSNLPISGATVTAKNARGDIISEVNSGADITADMTATQTTMSVDLRQNLKSNTLYRIDNEYITTGTVSGSGAGSVDITRESRYPNKFRKKFHKYNTVNFDKNIYEVCAATTDSNGQVTIWFPSFCLQAVNVTPAGTFPDQVTVGGVNYTCTTSHQASGSNIPPNATYWSATGSEGFPWLTNKYYSNGGAAKRSYTNLGPFSVSLKKAGFETLNDLFAPTIDTEATNKTVKMKRPNLSMTETARFG